MSTSLFSVCQLSAASAFMAALTGLWLFHRLSENAHYSELYLTGSELVAWSWSADAGRRRYLWVASAGFCHQMAVH